MANTVPYSGAPEVSPRLDPLSNVHIDTPQAAFGGAVAGAIQHLGETVSGAGKELFARANAMQEMDEQVKADQASADTMDAMTKRYLEFDQLRGAERTAGLQKYLDDVDQIRQDGMANLTSPYAKQQYLRESRRTQSQMVWHGGVLARQGQDQATGIALKSKRDAIVNQYSTVDPNDPNAFGDAADAVRKASEEEVHFRGGPAPGTPEAKQAAAPLTSDSISKMLIAKSNSDPIGAKRLFEKSRDEGLLTADDADKLSQRLDNAVNLKTGKQIGQKVVASNKDLVHADPRVVAKAARDAAEKADPGNQDLADNAEYSATTRQVNEQNLERRSFQEMTTTLRQGIDGSGTDGKVPTSLDEARQDPVWRDKFDSAPKSVRDSVQEQILANQKTSGWVPNEEGNKQFYNLHAALADPRASAAEVDEALNADLLKSPMTREQRKVIGDLQIKTLNDQNRAENVNSALNIAEVRTAMKASGIQKGTAEYDKFVTEFTQAIGAYAQGGHRSVKDHAQLGEIANKMLLQQTTEHLGGWWNTKTNPLYQDPFAANPTLKANAISDFKKLTGNIPTQEQLDSVAPLYFQKYFMELGAKSRPPTGKSTLRATPSTRKPADDTNPMGPR